MPRPDLSRTLARGQVSEAVLRPGPATPGPKRLARDPQLRNWTSGCPAGPARPAQRREPTRTRSKAPWRRRRWAGPEMFTSPSSAEPRGAAPPGRGGRGTPARAARWPPHPTSWPGVKPGPREPAVRPPARSLLRRVRPGETYGRAGGWCWAPRSPALHPAALDAACGRAARIFRVLPAPEGRATTRRHLRGRVTGSRAPLAPPLRHRFAGPITGPIPGPAPKPRPR